MKKYNKFSDKELWSLDYTIATFVLPRLIRFREINHGHPGSLDSQEQWNEMLDKMIYSFQHIVDDDHPLNVDGHDLVSEGLELFGKYFRALWI